MEESALSGQRVRTSGAHYDQPIGAVTKDSLPTWHLTRHDESKGK